LADKVAGADTPCFVLDRILQTLEGRHRPSCPAYRSSARSADTEPATDLTRSTLLGLMAAGIALPSCRKSTSDGVLDDGACCATIEPRSVLSLAARPDQQMVATPGRLQARARKPSPRHRLEEDPHLIVGQASACSGPSGSPVLLPSQRCRRGCALAPLLYLRSCSGSVSSCSHRNLEQSALKD
jgi:hypothetical protein